MSDLSSLLRELPDEFKPLAALEALRRKERTDEEKLGPATPPEDPEGKN